MIYEESHISGLFSADNAVAYRQILFRTDVAQTEIDDFDRAVGAQVDDRAVRFDDDAERRAVLFVTSKVYGAASVFLIVAAGAETVENAVVKAVSKKIFFIFNLFGLFNLLNHIKTIRF